MAHGIRKGDIVHLHGGDVAEVLSVVANNEGGLDAVLRIAARREKLSRTVLRKGGPDEREKDKETHFEDYEDDEKDVEVLEEVEDVEDVE